jgi:post-segregation antitoxin (ccd killing protein)
MPPASSRNGQKEDTMRKPLNITISDEARQMLERQAAELGLTVSRYIEMLAREKEKEKEKGE